MTSTHTETRSGPDGGRSAVPAAQVPLLRLHVLRAGYLVIGVGLAITRWPLFLRPEWPLTEGIVHCVLAATSILCLLGVRYPLQMLPVLLFEIAWKLIWLAVVALPQWAAGTMDRATWDVAFSCLFVVVLLAVVPWRHVAAHYGTGRGDRRRPVEGD